MQFVLEYSRNDWEYSVKKYSITSSFRSYDTRITDSLIVIVLIVMILEYRHFKFLKCNLLTLNDKTLKITSQ